MATCSRLVLVALCLTWTCAIRVLAQAPNPPSSHVGPEPSDHCDLSQAQPAAGAGCSPFEGLQLFDGVAPAAGENTKAACSLFDGFEFPYDGARSPAGLSGLDVVGNPASGGEPAAGGAGAPSVGIPPPLPFGGPRVR